MVCQQSDERTVTLQAVIRVCSHHDWLAYCEERSFQFRGLVLPIVVVHVSVVFWVVFLQTRQELRI